MKRIFWVLLLSLASTLGYAQNKLPLEVGKYQLDIQVMANAQSRQTGWMFVDAIEPNDGMLFVFPSSDRWCMWMKNTKIPLSVMFLDEKGVITNIEDMEPLTEISHCAIKPVQYAIEVPQGWLQQRGIGPGFKIPGVLRYPSLD